MIKLNKGIELDSFDQEILNYAIRTRQVESFILHTIETTNKLKLWNKRLYNACMFIILNSPLKI
jgi:hypothetical protein